MWKNVRAILAIIIVFAYLCYTGIEVWYTHTIPQNFYAVVMLVVNAYFLTRAIEGRKLPDIPKLDTTIAALEAETQPLNLPFPLGWR